MQDRPLSWIVGALVVSLVAAAADSARLWPRRTLTLGFTAVITVVGSLAILRGEESSYRALFLFIVLAVLYLGAAGAALTGPNALGTWRRRSDLEEALLIAALCLSVNLLVTICMRSVAAQWSPGEAGNLLLLWAPLACVAWLSGRSTYNLLMQRERTHGHDPREGSYLLGVATFAVTGVLTAGVVMILVLARPLGLDRSSGDVANQFHWTNPIALLIATIIASLGALLAYRSRGEAASDDRLRTSAPALMISSGALLAMVVIIGHDIATQPPALTVPFRVYTAIVAVLAGVLYLEDAVATPVWLHVLRPTWIAWLAGLAGGCTMASATYWMMNYRLWVKGGHGASIPFALAGLGSVALVALTVAALSLTLAWGSSSRQQLTAKTAAYNVIQGLLLYLALLTATTWAPSIVIARGNWQHPGNNIGAILVFLGIASLILAAYHYMIRNNADHLKDQQKLPSRDIRGIRTRASDPLSQERLNQERLRRLARHLWWQQRLSSTLLLVSLIGLAAAINGFLNPPPSTSKHSSTSATEPPGNDDTEEAH